MNYQNGSGVFTFVHCISGEPQTFDISNGIVKIKYEAERPGDVLSYVGPGLIDLQVNGINGINFNIPSLTEQQIINATEFLLSKGVTTFFPTIITNSDENILQIAQTINKACAASSLVNECIGGIHLEGPFISPVEGAKGAHDEKYIKAPDWELFKRFQQAAGGRIKIVTLAPEWEGSPAFIKNCSEHNVLTSIGHSMANTAQVRSAVKAGARLSTHLGNGIPLLLPRHPNIIWDQLSEEELYSCFIGDGIHIPDSLLTVIMKTKADRAILVSDATRLAGMPPGEYQDHIGGSVILDENKRISLKNSPGILAGAAKSLLENIEYLFCNDLATLAESWQMASTNITKMLAETTNEIVSDAKNDMVMFSVHEKNIKITRVIKNGHVVFEG